MKSNFGEKMFKDHSIQNKFRRILMGMIITFALISSVLVFVFSYTQINKQYEEEAKNVINLTNMLLESTFDNTQRSLISMKNYLVLPQNIESDIYYNETLQTFKNVFKSSSTIFISKKDGTFYLFPKRFVSEDYDPRTRPWYSIALMDKGRVNWTEPYVDHGTGEFTITASKYVGDDMVVGVDILLSEITKLVTESKIGDLGFVTILNDSGIVLASNNKNALAVNWNDLDTTITKFEKLMQNEKMSDAKYIHLTKSLSNLGLNIVASISLSEIYSTLTLIFFLIVMITSVVVTIAERISSSLSFKIINPILKLVKMMEKIESGDYSVHCDVVSDTEEVDILINGFNDMTASINEKNLEMQALNEQLIASESALQSQFDELYESKEYILKSEQRYKSIFEASEEGLWDVDENGVIQYLTPSWYLTFEMDISNSKLEDWFDLIHPDDIKRVKGIFDEIVKRHIENYRSEYRVKTKNGTYTWIEAVGNARYDNGHFKGMSGSHQNITARKEYELKIYDMAYKDSLTKLYNRRYFEDYFGKVLQNNGQGSLILLDIDNFKYINDIYGHTFGDEIIRQIAQRLLESVSNLSNSMVARFSGNEFIVLINDVDDRDSISVIVELLSKTIEKPFKHKSKIVKVTGSFGITKFPSDGSEVESLVQNADIAMYHAKRVTKKSYHYFDNEIKQNAINEMQIENLMRSAIDEGEFSVHYQPIVASDTTSLKGFEALVRWNSRQLGFIYPDSFISIAEKTGLINDLGLFVLESACAFISKYNGTYNTNLDVSINISVIQLIEDNFVNLVLDTIKKYDIPSQWIRLEITESMMLESNENVLAKLFYLRNHKVGVVLDDFGTGYSSFKNLIRLPLSGIKIDKTLMKDSLSNEHVFSLIDSIVDFAHKTNIDVVGEGIETEAYLTACRTLNVDYAQGYYFSKPLSEEQIFNK